MKGMMTRNEAAKYLGVNNQTITNWCNKGLLGSCRGETKTDYTVRMVRRWNVNQTFP